mmetsp:Transcript_21108/g.43261  ORF Transcript_21108/g.43261 Transcript_21108/m.43261 type:complete len:211 (+) Transcript_21108:685-1317(+)
MRWEKSTPGSFSSSLLDSRSTSSLLPSLLLLAPLLLIPPSTSFARLLKTATPSTSALHRPSRSSRIVANDGRPRGSWQQQDTSRRLMEAGEKGIGSSKVTGRHPSSTIGRTIRFIRLGALVLPFAFNHRSQMKSTMCESVAMSKSVIPNEYTSTLSSYASPRGISGAQYRGVPTAVMVTSSTPRAREVPKSPSLAVVNSDTKQFSGLRSR